MEVTGKIIQVLEPQSGVSKAGKNWTKRYYVLETQESYPRKIAFYAFGEDRVNQFDAIAKPGSSVRLSFDIECREYNGRWYTDIAGWKIEPLGGDVAAAAPAAPSYDNGIVPPPAVAPASSEDDLPF